MRKVLILTLISTFFSFSVFSQNKATVVANVWNNDLDNYNPIQFYSNLFNLFKKKLSLKEVSGDPAKLDFSKVAANWEKRIEDNLLVRNGKPDSIFYIAFTCQLKLPAINLGKLLFNNPPRSSKMTFTYKIFNGAGKKLAGDTIVNRGCIMRNVNEKNGVKPFYSDFDSFQSDLNCHFEIIEKHLKEKQINAIGKQYAET